MKNLGKTYDCFLPITKVGIYLPSVKAEHKVVVMLLGAAFPVSCPQEGICADPYRCACGVP